MTNTILPLNFYVILRFFGAFALSYVGPWNPNNYGDAFYDFFGLFHAAESSNLALGVRRVGFAEILLYNVEYPILALAGLLILNFFFAF